MSVAHEALGSRAGDAGGEPPLHGSVAPADGCRQALPEAGPDPVERPRSGLPPRPPVPSGPRAWARAVRVGALPLTLLGGVVAGLLAAGHDGLRPGLLALGLAGLAVAHALGALLRDLGDARPGRAGPLRRAEARRGALVLAGAGAVVLTALVVVRDARGTWLAAAGVLALVLAVSRRCSPASCAVAGLTAGVVAAGVTAWAATGSFDRSVALAGLAAGGVVAGLLAARRTRLTGVAARLIVLSPYLAVGAAVALEALPWPALAVALALPSARRASVAAGRRDAAPVVAGHARLAGLLLVAGLVGGALAASGAAA